MRVLEETVSIDEGHYYETGELRPVPARYVLDEKTGTVYLEKDSGTRERVGNLRYWERIKKFAAELETRAKKPVRKFSGYCLSCGLCDAHKNTTALLNVVGTNLCDLRCWYCFFYSEASGYAYYPSLEEIKKMFELAKEVNGYMPPVQITGGEPTLRDDLAEVIRTAKELGAAHVQLNTNSVKIGIMYYEEPEKAKDYVEELRKAGLNTVYTSFDGVDPETNFKNHYEIPFALRAYHEGGVRSIVLVPTVFRENIHQVPEILEFAVRNRRWGIKGVNYQPISIVGMTPKSEREKLRVTQADVMEALEPLGLDVSDWYPVSSVQFLADIMSPAADNVHFYNSEKCGVATYVFVDGDRVRPITEYVDVDAFLDEVREIYRSWRKRILLGLHLLKRYVLGRSEREILLEKFDEYIRRRHLPDGTDLRAIIARAIETGQYSDLGRFHENALFVGMMHFMDPFNYDVGRVQRCSIHYAGPSGIYPFCTYNVWSERYRDALLRAFRVKDRETEKKLMEYEKAQAEKVREFRKKADEIREHPVYREAYGL